MATNLKNSLLAIFTAFLLLQIGFTDKVRKKIYRSIDHIFPCVTLTNATHQIGCTSDHGGHVGVVHYIQTQEDVNWLLSHHGNHAPYIPLFTSDMFNEKSLDILVKKKIINGALVIFEVRNGGAPKHGFSPDYGCPNDRFGIYNGDSTYGSCKKVMWNEHGSGMSFSYYGIPIFALNNQTDINWIIECFEKYNKPTNGTVPDYPLCAIELKDFMFAAKDTPTCMRKTQIPKANPNQFCDPLGDYNVWGSLYPIKDTPKKGDIIVAAAKLDSSSFFHDLVRGADNDASGVIALLAAAQILGELKRNGTEAPPKKPIMFTFFQGESWDYIGSSRMVYDMKENKFPPNSWKVQSGDELKLNTSNIGYFIELNQVGLGTGPLWAHSDPISRANKDVNEKVDHLFKVLHSASKNTGVLVNDASDKKSQPLPPASFQSFLRTNQEIPGIVLTDHKTKYVNKFYNSRFDDADNVLGNYTKDNAFSQRLTEVATTIANALYTLANDGKPPKKRLQVHKDLVERLVYCSFYRANCSLHKEAFPTSTRLPTMALPRYVSVNTINNTLTIITRNLLLYFTGDHMNTSTKCSSDGPNILKEMKGSSKDSICVNGSVYYSIAESPAFLLEKYDSTEYSTWAESTWNNDLSVTLFLVSSPESQVVTLISGIIMTLISFGLIFFINRKADQLFTPQISLPQEPEAES